MQIVKLKKNAIGRWLSHISDSTYKMTCLFPSEWGKRIENEEIMEGSVVLAKDFVPDVLHGKAVLVLKNLTVLQFNCVEIGQLELLLAFEERLSGEDDF